MTYYQLLKKNSPEHFEKVEDIIQDYFFGGLGLAEVKSKHKVPYETVSKIVSAYIGDPSRPYIIGIHLDLNDTQKFNVDVINSASNPELYLMKEVKILKTIWPVQK